MAPNLVALYNYFIEGTGDWKSIPDIDFLPNGVPLADESRMLLRLPQWWKFGESLNDVNLIESMNEQADIASGQVCVCITSLPKIKSQLWAGIAK